MSDWTGAAADRITAVIAAVFDAAERDGLITRNEPRLVRCEPTDAQRRDRVLGCVLVSSGPPYTVAEGREREMQDLLEAAVAEAISRTATYRP